MARHRRAGVPVVLLLLTCALLATGLVTAARRPVAPPPSLLLDGVVLESRGGRTVVAAVPPGGAQEYLPGSRVAPDTGLTRVAAAQAAWLREGSIPGGRWEEMTTGALLDLHTLTGATFSSGPQAAAGAVVAGWIPTWRLVWPRDAAFVAVALARTGHREDAVAVLEFLQDQQRADGTFAARHLPWGGPVDDGRADQLDAVGYVLWAVRLTGGDPRLDLLVERATARLLAVTSGPDPLPPPSSDSWEVREDRLTLGTAAATLMGLDAAVVLADPADEPLLALRRDALRARIVAEFGPTYARYVNPVRVGPLVRAAGCGRERRAPPPPVRSRAVTRRGAGVGPDAPHPAPAGGWSLAGRGVAERRRLVDPADHAVRLGGGRERPRGRGGRPARLDGRTPHLLRGDPGEGDRLRRAPIRRAPHMVRGERAPRRGRPGPPGWAVTLRPRNVGGTLWAWPSTPR